MNRTIKTIGIILLVILILFGLSWGSAYMRVQYRKVFEPMNKEVDRQVWEATPSRINGAKQEIGKRYLEYQKTDDNDEKSAICMYLRTAYPDITADEIEDYRLNNFINICRYGE